VRWLLEHNTAAAERIGGFAFAHPQLVEVLTVMSATVVPAATLTLDIPRRGADAAQLAADPTVAPALRAAVAALLEALTGTDPPTSAT
jgi:hypothetical protein